jgi:hypothetical protein
VARLGLLVITPLEEISNAEGSSLKREKGILVMLVMKVEL